MNWERPGMIPLFVPGSNNQVLSPTVKRFCRLELTESDGKRALVSGAKPGLITVVGFFLGFP